MRPPFFWGLLCFRIGFQAAYMLAGVAAYQWFGFWGAFAVFAILAGLRFALMAELFPFALVVGVCIAAAIVGYESASGAWGLLLVLVAIAIAQYAATSRKGQFIMAELESFRESAKILRGASVEVHSIEPAPPPEWNGDSEAEGVTAADFDDLQEYDEFRREAEEEKREEAQWRTDEDVEFEKQEHIEWSSRLNWYHVEATIRPKLNEEVSDATKWKPGELN